MTYKRINASNDDIDVGAGTRIRGILLTSGSDAATLVVFKGATQVGGDEMAKLAVTAANTTAFVPLDHPGLYVGDKISVTITGTAADAYLYIE